MADRTDLVLLFGVFPHLVMERGLERTKFSSFTIYVKIINRQGIEMNTIPSVDGLYVYLFNRNLLVFAAWSNITGRIAPSEVMSLLCGLRHCIKQGALLIFVGKM